MDRSRIRKRKIYNLLFDLPNAHKYSRSKLYQTMKLMNYGSPFVQWGSKKLLLYSYKYFIEHAVSRPRQMMLIILNEYLEDARKRRFLEIFDRKFTCCICLEDVEYVAKNKQFFKDKKNILVALLPCRHSFCDECLTQTYLTALCMRCPLCRNSFGCEVRHEDSIEFQLKYYDDIMRIEDLHERKIAILKLLNFMSYNDKTIIKKINAELIMIYKYENRIN